METHGTTYLIYGNEIDVDSQKNPVKRSLKFAYFRTTVRLLMPIIVYISAFYFIRQLTGNAVGQIIVVSAEETEMYGDMITSFLLMFVAVCFVMFRFFSIKENNKPVTISRVTQTILGVFYLISVLPFLSLGHLIILFILLIISPSITYTKHLFGLMKFRKGKWKPEYLDLYEEHKIGDWFKGDVPDSGFSQVEQSSKGKEV